MMKTLKALMVGSAIVAMAAVAAPASAATTLTLSPGPGGTLTGSFSESGIAAGIQTFVYNFTLPSNGMTSGSISTSFSSAANDYNFTTVTLNGTPFTLSPTGQFEFGSIILSTMTGVQTLSVAGLSFGNGSFGGQITFTPMAAAVPEPATWALMLTGFGIVGGAMRRRKQSVRTAVSFA